MENMQQQWRRCFVINYISPLKNICSLLLVILAMWLKQHLVVVECVVVIMIGEMISLVSIHLRVWFNVK
jgi:hypothetical protein